MDDTIGVVAFTRRRESTSRFTSERKNGLRERKEGEGVAMMIRID